MRRFAAYMAEFRAHGPMSAWEAAKRIGLRPQRGWEWARALERMGLLERCVFADARGYRVRLRVTQQGRDPVQAIRQIGHYGAISVQRPGPLSAVRESDRARALEVSAELEDDIRSAAADGAGRVPRLPRAEDEVPDVQDLPAPAASDREVQGEEG